MVAITVLIPTHDHAEMLTRAVASVQAQTVADWELFIIGDGVPDRTRDLLTELVAADSRLRFFDRPKGPRHGELHRHAALDEAQGEIVCYLSDDDLWLPHHLQTMQELLATGDFGHTVHVDVTTDGRIEAYPYDLADPVARRRQVDEAFNFFGLSVAGHTLAAYRRLPHGWRTTPAGLWTDLHMWRQFLDQPWCRVQTDWRPTSLQFPSPPRRDWTLEQRLAELDEWVNRSRQPGFLPWLTAEVELRRSQAITARDTLISERDQAIVSLHTAIAEQNRGIASLQDGLAERDQGIAWLRGEVATNQAALATTQEHLAQSEKTQVSQAARLTHLTDEVAGLRAALQTEQATVAALRANDTHLRSELATRDARLDAIYRSRWWRLANTFWRARRALRRLASGSSR